MNWSAPASDGGSPITGYNVYEGTSLGGESLTPVNASPLPATASSFDATGLTNGTTYYVTVTALNGVGESAASNEASATPSSSPTAPGTPTHVTAVAGETKVTLTWTAPRCDGANAITGYNVYIGTTRGGESGTPVNASPISAHATHYTVTGLESGTKYYFRVKAINAVGVGAPSNEVSATLKTGANTSSGRWLVGPGRRML